MTFCIKNCFFYQLLFCIFLYLDILLNMPLQNASINVTEFIIGGFDKTKRPMVVGVVILITYVLSILANMFNILFIIYDQRLHKPMYILICNLAVVDIMYTSTFVKLSSNIDKRKMGTTCLSHLIVVMGYYSPIFTNSVLTRIGLVVVVVEGG
ncbi:putative olfactory receptor 2B3 [Sebastes umbrosus]|uniref:putative olfactory receptor 2B3 n=1 Tax=Sebastes umbrosus TaxID=72105 RepID=UPI0018A0381A|nr:putative olfactory receptor 2B3 [Sebastes umbrosus]